MIWLILIAVIIILIVAFVWLWQSKKTESSAPAEELDLNRLDVGGVVYWMSSDAFFKFDGTVRKIPCTVEDFIFDNIGLSFLIKKGRLSYA